MEVLICQFLAGLRDDGGSFDLLDRNPSFAVCRKAAKPSCMMSELNAREADRSHEIFDVP